MWNPETNSSPISSRENVTVQNFKDELIDVIIHIGSTINTGHYTSAIKVSIIWYYYNIKIVIVVDFTDMCDYNDSYIIYNNAAYC